MKRTFLYFLGLLLLGQTTHSFAQSNEWENPLIIDFHKEQPHATFMLFDDANQVIADDYNQSPYYKSLNGKWKFSFVDKYANRLKDFYKIDLPDRGAYPHKPYCF